MSTAESKEVRKFYVNPRTYHRLLCGGPIRSSDPRYGYRHILKYHKTDFESLAVGTGQNWRDVADLVMDTIASDPDFAKPANGGQGCYSRVMYLYNTRNGQLVRTKIFRMYVQLTPKPNQPANTINTVYLASAHCPTI